MSKERICNMKKDIKSIVTLKSNSASPTDTWLVNFKEEQELKPVGYSDFTITYNSAFMKISFNAKDVKNTSEMLDATIAIYYEADIYLKVTNPLIFSGVCPHFVTCYDYTSDACSFNQMVDLLQGKITPALSEKQIKTNMLRNAAYMLKGLEYRPALGSITPHHVSEPKAEGFRYHCLMNQSMADAKSYSEWLEERKKDRSPSTVRDIWELVFQIAIACYAMGLSRMAHNDLHSGNIYVKKVNKLKTIIYKVDDEVYTFVPKYVPYLYDFDRSYVEWKGKNEFNEGYYCESYSQCNEVVGNKDFIKSCCYLVKHLRDLVPEVEEILGAHKGKLQMVQADHECMLRKAKGKGKGLLGSWFDKYFSPMEDIIPRIYEKFWDGRTPTKKIDTADVHCLEKDLFEKDGKVKVKSALKRIAEMCGNGCVVLV